MKFVIGGAFALVTLFAGAEAYAQCCTANYQVRNCGPGSFSGGSSSTASGSSSSGSYYNNYGSGGGSSSGSGSYSSLGGYAPCLPAPGSPNGTPNGASSEKPNGSANGEPNGGIKNAPDGSTQVLPNGASTASAVRPTSPITLKPLLPKPCIKGSDEKGQPRAC